VSQGRTRRLLCATALAFCVNPATLPLVFWAYGFYFVREEEKRYAHSLDLPRDLALFMVAKARFYYMAPMYPVCLQAGAILWGSLDTIAASRWRACRGGNSVGGILVVLPFFAPIVMPVAPIGSGLWNFTSKMHDQFREEIGWTDWHKRWQACTNRCR